jgi:hypothetical protein
VIVSLNKPSPDRINILVTSYRLNDATCNKLVTSGVPYVVYQTEVLSPHGINVVHTSDGVLGVGTQRDLQRYLALLSNATMVWECFGFNQSFMENFKIRADLIRHGYHPDLEGRPRKKEIDYDFLFFGSLTPYRKQVLKNYNQTELRILTLEPPMFRDQVLRGSKVNLSVRAHSSGMTHLPHFRVLTGLYHDTVTVAEFCSEQEWMKDMVIMVQPEEFLETTKRVASTDEWRDLASDFKKRFVQRPMVRYMEPLIEELGHRLKTNEKAGGS